MRLEITCDQAFVDDDESMVENSVRRSAEDLRDRLDLSRGDVAAKRSAFWVMLTLSGVIAAAGVLIDSAATVIGAMIIAPLATPIFGVAFGVVSGSTGLVGRSLRRVSLGALAVVAIGVAVVTVSPENADLVQSSQVLSRTLPRLGDLLAAIATGLAGSFAVMRKDLSDALPGVAIAISLVPPLVVVGVCLGAGALFQALGALILFLSNVAAMIATCTLVLALSGYRRRFRGSIRGYVAVTGFLIAVAIPIAFNSVALLLVSQWTAEVDQTATAWISQTPGAEVESTKWEGRTLVITVRSPQQLPPLGELERAVYRGNLPSAVKLSVIHTVGNRL
jgi:uncharacterized hydrophobic protein (TIGR00271 family)